MTDRVEWASPPPRHPGPVVYYLYLGQYIIPSWLVERLRDEGNEGLAAAMEPVYQRELDDAFAAMEDTENGRAPWTSHQSR